MTLTSDSFREQGDLALLPEPRFIYSAPKWLRAFTLCILLVGAVLSGGILVQALGTDGNIWVAIWSAGALLICLVVLINGRPTDWRVWISLAASPDGLYLVGRKRRVIFVPWSDVEAIDIEQRVAYKGSGKFARLTLRLPEESWAQFGQLSSIKGSGEVRQYLLSALCMPGEELVAALREFRKTYV